VRVFVATNQQIGALAEDINNGMPKTSATQCEGVMEPRSSCANDHGTRVGWLAHGFRAKVRQDPEGQSLRLWKDRVDWCQSFIQQLIGTLVWLALHPARGIPEDLGQ
jgi:hypothetical protein